MNAWIVDVGEADFDQQVVEASRQQPVLVDFWAGWCGPCKMLMPVLDAVVQSYNGKVRLAKVDTDREQRLAGQWGVRSLPTVKLFRNGTVVDEFMGVQPESAIRALIEKHLPRASDEVLQAVETALQNRQLTADHLQQVRKAVAMDPDYPRARLVLLQVLMNLGELEEAEKILKNLPADLRMDESVQALSAQLKLLKSGGDVDELRQRLRAEPDNCALHLQLAAALLSRQQWQEGLETYLKVLEKGDSHERKQAREGLLAAFDLVEDRSLVNAFRKKMATLVF